jgi:uncharacterized cupredoxin-like copper-binding protein
MSIYLVMNLVMYLGVDVEPGKVAELELTAQKSGDFDFFCGGGH